MITIQSLLNAIEDLAPARFAFDFDRIGLQVGDPDMPLAGVVTTLDCTEDAVEYAIKSGANAIVAHHPLIWDPLKVIHTNLGVSKVVTRLIRSNIALISSHTNWDCAPGGINDTFAEMLELQEVVPFGSGSDSKAYKLVTFAPSNFSDRIIEALSEAGAGRIGNYSSCSFQTSGSGTFLPLPGANPNVGEVGKLTKCEEVRIEMVVPEKRLSQCMSALKKVHPYEEVAYDLLKTETGNGYPIGRIGHLAKPMPSSEFVQFVNNKLETRSYLWQGHERLIQKVAVVGGAADDESRKAITVGADVMVTGEVKHNIAIESASAGLSIVQAGHFATENPGMGAMQKRLSSIFKDVNVTWFNPAHCPGKPIF